MKNEILEALTIIEEENNRTKRDIEIIKQAKQEIERLNNIIHKAILELERYENDGEANYYAPIKETLDILRGSDKE